jgi:hypothetical protein
MTDCAQYRRALLSDPHDDHADLRQHVAGCAECARFRDQVLGFEQRLGRAMRMELGVGANRQTGVAVPPRAGRRLRRRRGWLAAAASVLLAAAVGGGLWLGAPGSSLAADVTSHMAGEPGAWARTQVPVPGPQLDRVLGESQVRLKANPGLVSYANSCEFRGHKVPHLVVQTEAGPVTVMVLTHEFPRTEMRFDEGGYRGMIVPVAGRGSIAVLAREPAAHSGTLQRVAATVVAALDWPA